MTTFPVDVSARIYARDPFGRFMRQIDDAAENTAYAAAKRGAFLSRVFAPKRTLRLASAIFAYRHSTGKTAGWKVEGVPYAAAQDKGAAAHQIGAEGQVLANESDNFGPVVGPVSHPGNPATHFMSKAREQVARELVDMMRASIKKQP
jgi:hypothetical protein